MSNNSTLISNMSYTSRDFNSIYPELLDLVKKITYKWDPSISNESDPGVILLKLNALIADKVNYNIDKNVLECFPLSVTQEANARQLYEQLGYFMKWYRSATTQVSLTWIDFDNYERSDSAYVDLPRFTMVSDYENTMVYTLLGTADSEWNSASVNRVYLNGESTILNAIQGVAVAYDINGETTIQASDLDSNNRLYFNDSDIAENGIFISNVDTFNFADWQRKDSLAPEALGNTYYSFGVLPGSNTCYLEFPEDADTIFANGINIVYIRTMGHDGNIPVNYLEKFYNDLTTILTRDNETSNVLLNLDTIEIANIIPGAGGEEKEELDDAYRNYRHTIGTFDTLITLRDYINAIINSPQYASNAIVTDRNSDIQCVYKIMTSVNNVPTLVNKVDAHDDIITMNAYNLKLYVLDYASPTLNTAKLYNQSFQLLSDNELERIRLYLEDEKAIPHDYSNIRTPEQDISYKLLEEEPNDWDIDCTQYFYYDDQEEDYVPVEAETSWEEDLYYQKDIYFRSHFCLFKNLYPIECRITPTRTLDDIEQADVKANILESLYENLNSRKLDFGETVTAYEIEQIIVNSDERISSASIQNIYMETYAVYWNGINFQTINLSRYSESENPEPYLYSYSNPKYSVWRAKDTFKEDRDKEWGVYTFQYIKLSSSNYYWAMSKIEGNDGPSSFEIIQDLGDYIANPEDISYASMKPGDWFRIEINPVDKFREEIYVKSVLRGISPLFISDSEFNYDIDQVKNMTDVSDGIYDDVVSIESNVDITFTNNLNYYTLRDNESLRFCTANLLDGSKYSNYCKYYFVSPKEDPTITAKTNRKLDEGEYLFLFYKETNDTLETYKYEVYGAGNIIYPEDFVLTADSDTIQDDVFQELAQNMYNAGSEVAPRYIGSSAKYRSLYPEENTYAENLRNWLSGTKTIQIKYINSIRIPDTYLCYWVLNSETSTQIDRGDGSSYTQSKYILFEDFTGVEDYSTSSNYQIGDKVIYEDNYYECINAVTASAFDPDDWRQISATEYILNTGEYFFYKTSTGSGLNILGAGTRIVRPDSDLSEFAVDVVNISEINTDDQILNGLWFSKSSVYFDVTEQQYINIGSGATVYLEFDPQGTSTSYEISSTYYTELSDIKSIRYTFNNLSEEQKSIAVNYDNVLSAMSNIDVWRAISILNLSLDAHKEQPLLSDQALILNYSSKSHSDVIIGEDAETSSEYLYPVVVQSMLDTNPVMSNNITTTIDIDENDNITYNKIYTYSKLKNVIASSPTDITVTYSTEGGATIAFPPSVSLSSRSAELKFAIPSIESNSEGYIISIYNPYDNLGTAVLTASLQIGTGIVIPLYPIAEKFNNNLAAPGTYFFILPLESQDYENELTLIITLSNLITSEAKLITINKLFKYNKPENLSDSQFANYINLIPQFDVDNEFLYTYEIPESVYIEDPLKPETFLNSHHIYNSFTICQLNTKNTSNKSLIISTR